MGGLQLAWEPSQPDSIIGEDGQAHPRTIWRAQDGTLMLDLRELAQVR